METVSLPFHRRFRLAAKSHTPPTAGRKSNRGLTRTFRPETPCLRQAQGSFSVPQQAIIKVWIADRLQAGS
jgi:hypothetical protein